MFSVRHDFGISGRIFGIPRAWLSRIGAFCSSFSTRGRLINISIPDNPSPNSAPVVFEINEAALRAFVIANAPSSDPDIPDNILTSDDIGTTVAAQSHTHSGYAASNHTHSNYIDLSSTQTITGAKRFDNQRLIVCAKNGDSDGTTATMPFRNGSNTTTWGGLQASAAQFVAYFTNQSSINTRINIADDAVTVTKNNQDGSVALSANGSISLTSRSNGASISFRYAGATADTAYISESSSGYLALKNHPVTDTSASGYSALAIATVQTVTASDPGSSVTSLAPTSDEANNSTWAAGGSNGLAVTKLMRTKYVTSGTTPILYAYYRTYKYDNLGRLYSVSKETREIVANTAVISWA